MKTHITWKLSRFVSWSNLKIFDCCSMFMKYLSKIADGGQKKMITIGKLHMTLFVNRKHTRHIGRRKHIFKYLLWMMMIIFMLVHLVTQHFSKLSMVVWWHNIFQNYGWWTRQTHTRRIFFQTTESFRMIKHRRRTLFWLWSTEQ